MIAYLRIMLCVSCLALQTACSALSGFSGSHASGYRVLQNEQCVPYARRVSGIPLYGDAWTWWGQAAGVYMRGNHPMPGAVMVLARTNKLRYGHVAVVKQVLGRRDINVTHANWGDDPISRRIVYESMHVQDISAGNDWSSVRFWNPEHNVFGFPYAVQGFIYNMRLNNPGYPAGI